MLHKSHTDSVGEQGGPLLVCSARQTGEAVHLFFEIRTFSRNEMSTLHNVKKTPVKFQEEIP